MTNYKIIIAALIGVFDASDADIAISAIASELSAAGDDESIIAIIAALRELDALPTTANEIESQLL